MDDWLRFSYVEDIFWILTQMHYYLVLFQLENVNKYVNTPRQSLSYIILISSHCSVLVDHLKLTLNQYFANLLSPESIIIFKGKLSFSFSSFISNAHILNYAEIAVHCSLKSRGGMAASITHLIQCLVENSFEWRFFMLTRPNSSFPKKK